MLGWTRRVLIAIAAKLAAIPHEILLFMEIFFIAIPLLLHGIYGVYIALQAKIIQLIMVMLVTGNSIYKE